MQNATSHDYLTCISQDILISYIIVCFLIAVSGYPLSAAYCITRITGALERKWKIL